MYLHHGGGNSLGWFDREELKRVQNSVFGAVYSFAFLSKKPDIKILPYELEETFYIGLSGGAENSNSLIYDQKDKKKKRGMYYTLFAKRMNQHFSQFRNDREKHLEKKYELFKEHFLPSLNPDKKIYTNICVPGPVTKDYLIRAHLSLVESEFIYCYAQRFDDLPLMNIDENKQKHRSQKETSISKRQIESIAYGNLEKFLV
jgi:hypothetical protein